VVCAAQAAGIDPQHAVVLAGFGNRKMPGNERTRFLEDHRVSQVLGHAVSLA
jgi:hypothetical protein